MHAELVAQAKRGDREAFDSLARLTGDRCMAIAFRILRDYDLADDAVQSALLTAWREIRTLRDPRLFEPWLHRILTTRATPRPGVARAGRRGSDSCRSSPCTGPTSTWQSTIEISSSVPSDGSPSSSARSLVFHHYLGLPLPEVAARIGVPVGTVKSRMHHAKRALRAILEADARASTASGERTA